MRYTKTLAAQCLNYGHALRPDLPHDWPYWCCHHEVLAEIVTNPYERIGYILDNKPAHEIARRLAEFRPFADRGLALAEYKRVRDLALAEYKRVCGPVWAELEKQHKIECPDSQWNGKTIFPEGGN